MRYIGSKTTTLAELDRIVRSRITSGNFCDPFGGMGVVGSHFKAAGFTVHTGDLLTFAHHFQIARVVLQRAPVPLALRRHLGVRSAGDVCDYLNALPNVRSFIYREFADARHYFTPENASRIDAARRELARWRRSGWLGPKSWAYYSACLIDAVDRVANTAGTYYAYLKNWHRKSLQPFSVIPIATTLGPPGCTSSLVDATTLVGQHRWDVLYLDPPYNTRDYAGYYHLPETLATLRRPRPVGKSGVDAAPRPISSFGRPRVAREAFEQLLRDARFKLLLLHYSDDGLVPRREMRKLLRARGRVEEITIEAVGYSNKGSRHVTHRLFVVEP